jgi:hypothetical protein
VPDDTGHRQHEDRVHAQRNHWALNCNGYFTLNCNFLSYPAAATLRRSSPYQATGFRDPNQFPAWGFTGLPRYALSLPSIVSNG